MTTRSERFDADEFRRQWEAGITIPKMSEHFGVSRASISHWRRRLELPARASGGQSGHPAKLSEATIQRRERVREMHSRGATNKQMLEALGLNARGGYDTIANDLKALGLRRVGEALASRPRPERPKQPKPCPRCYAPMDTTATGYECVRHGVPVADTWVAA